MASPCTICNTPNAQICGRCKSTKYCSTECQQTDWPTHRLLCAQYKNNASLGPRPTPSHKNAIYFPTDSTTPIFIWIDCVTRIDDDTGLTYESSILAALISPDHPFETYMPIGRNPARDRDLPNTLELAYRETFLIDGSERNQSIANSIRDTGVTSHDWRGPLVAMKKKGPGIDPLFYTDMTMEDFRDTVDYLSSYNTPRATTPIGKTKGVKIACRGEQLVLGSPEYTAIDIPRDHPVFSTPIVSISKFVGLPVRVFKYAADKRWKDSRDVNDVFRNSPATFLHLEADTSKESWGWAPWYYQNNVGNVLVVGNEGDVTTEQIEILCRFCQFKMQPLFENGIGSGLVEMTREEVMGYVTPAKFGEYAAEVREKEKSAHTT